MGAPDLLQHLRSAGFDLAVTPEGGLKVTPSSALDGANRKAIRDHKAALLALLMCSQPEDFQRDQTLSACTHAPIETVRDYDAEHAEPVDLAPDGKTEAECERYAWRMERLTRWGWPLAEAQELAERLTRRDRTDDDRVTCTDCHHYRPGRCGNRRRAGLSVMDVGRDLAATLQQCPGFRP